MRNLISFFLLSAFSFALSACASSVTPAPGDWIRLGSKKVNFRLDRDEILVTARDGKFRKIRLEVSGASVNFHDITIVFGDGSRQKVNVRKTIHEGQSTRVIDLKGGRRVIRKVIFVYDTRNNENRKGKVTLYGMR